MKRVNVDQSKNKQKAMALAQANRLEEASALYKKICSKDSVDIEAWFMHGAVSGLLNQFATAERCFRHVLKLHPGHAQAAISLGTSLHAQERLDEAAKVLESVLALNPGLVEVYFGLGNVLKDQGDPDKAIERYQKALQLQPGYSEAAGNLALLLEQRGDAEKALQCIELNLAHTPNHAEMQYRAGVLAQKLQRLDVAQQRFRKVLELQPSHIAACYGLGNVLSLLGKVEESLQCFEQVLSVQPDNRDALLNAAALHSYTGHIESATLYFGKLIEIDPQNTSALVGLGYVRNQEGSLDDSIALYRRVQEIDPDSVDAAVGIGKVMEQRGDFEAAYKSIEPFLESEHLSVGVAVVLGLIAKRLDREQEAIEIIESMLRRKPFEPLQRKELHFALARLYNDLGQYSKAIIQAKQANEAVPARIDFEEIFEQAERIKCVFTAEFFVNAPQPGSSTGHLLFIVGMPRSGTSLTEQILASHPEIFGAGELIDIFEIAESLSAELGSEKPYPECMSELNQHKLDQISKRYLSRISELSSGAPRAVDKMMTNYWHLGLIAVMFPDARIIHCKRDPLDTCVSCYLQDFAGRHTYSKDLEYLGDYYRTYEKLMAHWEKVLPLQMMEVQYEDMVADQQGISKRLIEFCGLEWDESCLQFHRSRREVHTASYDQVRKPIYRKAIGRWKDYEEHLDPLIAALEKDR